MMDDLLDDYAGGPPQWLGQSVLANEFSPCEKQCRQTGLMGSA